MIFGNDFKGINSCSGRVIFDEYQPFVLILIVANACFAVYFIYVIYFLTKNNYMYVDSETCNSCASVMRKSSVYFIQSILHLDHSLCYMKMCVSHI